MQRAAVLFTGRVKTWEEQLTYLQSMKVSIEASTGLPVDFFCSAGCYKESFDGFVAALDVKASEYTTYEIDPVILTYPVLGPGTKHYNYTSMLFHMKNAHRIMEEYATANGIEYKVVVRWRADLICHTPFKIAWPIPLNTIFVPQCDDNGGINDRCAYGEGVAMKKYTHLYDYIHEFAKDLPMHAETYLLRHIRTQGLQTQRYELSTRLHDGRS